MRPIRQAGGVGVVRRAIVVGAGVVGLATAASLVDAGFEVLCLDAGEPMAARSAGGTRVFRLAHSDPYLVAAAVRARRIWETWSERAGTLLLGREGTIVTGERVATWAAAMEAADAEHSDGDGRAALPGTPYGPILHDPGGGVLAMAGAGRFLRAVARPQRGRVEAIAPDGRVIVDGAVERADVVVVAAGTGTPALAADLGVVVPDGLVHHARFSFAPRPGRSLNGAPCWLDGVPDGSLSSTYQHVTEEGYWAVGGMLPPAEIAWELGEQAATRRAEAAIVAHVEEFLPDLDPTPVATIPCSLAREGGDGVHFARAGVVHLVWGENLAKLAPVIGSALTGAITEDTSANLANG